LSGKLAENVLSFARVLRDAGLAIGPGSVLDALAALTVIDLGKRSEMRACLQATLIRRREDIALFDLAFDRFFRDPFGAEEAMAALLPRSPADPDRDDALPQRLADALAPNAPRPEPRAEEVDPIDVNAFLSFSELETLRNKDFASMTADDLERAREIVKRMRLSLERVPTRRLRADPKGHRVDGRATLRAAMRSGGQDIPLRFRARRTVAPPLVILCDISGSMSRYTEMLLRFAHVLMEKRARVACFLFGTRLSNVTRALKHRDVDVALASCGARVTDWGGGTRIGACLSEFNRVWSRRVLGQGAIVLLITDGLDRDAGDGLAETAERLHKSCRRLVWLNPLLSFRGFEPKASGIRAMLPHVDDFLPVHDLDSLAALARALGTTAV
jgi:hypothetical protein